MDYEGNTKKRKRSSSADTAGFSSGGKYQVFLSLRGKDTCKTFTDYEGNRKKRKGSSSADTAGSSSSASALASGGKYQVFLSFSGKDTRKTFTDYLYQDLVGAGIRTFRDDDKLPVGERIGPALLKAIQESKICIPIFSRGYASSKWCLRELAWMVHCGKQILPIFYDVTPDDVRYQTGSYEEAFRRHQNDFDQEIVQGWKDALRVVGGMKEWELEKETKGHEGELVKIVVSKVLLELKKKYMVVPDYLVGIDRHEEEMTKLLHVGSNGVHIVGIYGMGGIGKTTIAKVIYNKFSVQFDCCCFLENVREVSKHYNGLFNLQIQLISEIRKHKCYNDIANVDEGINTIKDIVRKKKVLIVLDDVDEITQFDMIIGNRDWFYSGSRIIITTRNKYVLNCLEVDSTYEPPLMEPDQSLKLFCKHAFGRDFPPDDFDILSKSVVSTVAGLPLALEIIGSFLFGKDKEVWEETLSKKKPHDDVQKVLRISYESLNVEQKKMFLDIACLFIGKDKRLPFYMWDDCKFYPTLGIDVLQLKSLVKIEDDKWLRMHDQLRDLGRQIVREERKLGEHSRLFIHEEALDVLKKHTGTKKVEAICVDACDTSEVFTDEEFQKLPNLRFLRVDYADLVGDFKHLLLNLRWLQWRKCPGNSTPTNFHLKNLIILDLSNSCYLKDDWEGWSQIKMAKKLKVLNLSRCNGLTRTPDFSTLTALEILNLGERENSVEIHPSVWKLKNLRVLDISGNICITAIRPIKFPDEIGNLEKLEEIDASHRSDLHGEIPSSIGRLSSLRILRLSSTNIYSLPTSICGLSCLETLDLLCCNKLQSLPDELPSSLTSLRVTCQSMETFPSCLSNLINLKNLTFYSCVNLVEVTRDIQKLSQLETLFLQSCNKLRTLPAEIGAISRLKKLRLFYCGNLQCILALPPSLFNIRVEYCQSLERLPDLSNLKNLSSLKLRHLDKLREIPELGELKYLDVSGCTSLERLDLSSLKNLKKLTILHCKNLTEIQGLEELESLGFLNMAGCKLIENLPDLSNLKKLKILIAFFCEKLTEIRGLEELKSLKLLDISGCKSIERLPDLSNIRIDTNSSRAKKWEAEGWNGYERHEWNGWELEEWEIPCSPSSSLKASKSEQKVKKVYDKGNTSADTAGSSSSASAPASGGEYEVFLSFRGKDTCKAFTDYLYHALVHVGIRTFRDDDELRVGEKIGTKRLKAIKDSKISIPIFSRDYASSESCLNELVQMVECHKTMGHKILPIFYDVKLSDVVDQGGTYKEAFRKHQKDFKEDIVRRWKEDLKAVGEIKGWELKEATNGHEGELVKRVVSKVLLELKKNYMVVTDNLVGIYHHEEEMTKLLHVGSNGVHIVGIYGMGGIGKTTIAKVIYNKFSVHFDCCCFLSDVRETSQQHNGLLSLQNQLISKIKKNQKAQADNVDGGINMIKRIFCNKKVFIVLDDVDDKSQFDKIVGNRGSFGSGSRIIVTTRDRHVLLLLKADETYEPPVMEDCHSLQLFSKHAFMRESPPEDYHIISESIVSTAAGLPLALEIIGSFLCAKEKAAWEDTFGELKEIPDCSVQEKLRISYKALDNFQQQIFLDIACFFIGVDKRLPFYFWDGCGFFPNKAVDVLKLRSLVKIGDDNILRMHDQLRDLGRQIVCEKNLNDPGEHSRLFRHNEALDVLVKQMGTRNVEALELNCSTGRQSPYHFTAEEFKELRNLRYLRVDNADLDGDFTGIFFNLRWLQWRECPRQFSPSNIDLKNLVILDLSDNKYLKDDWEGWSQIKMANRLKVLNLRGCSGLTKTPDISTSTTLEILNLGQRENLVEIHPSIWKLKELRVLDISRDFHTYAVRPITKFAKFPDEIGNLEKLEEINASFSRGLHGEIPSSIGRLSSLRILRLCGTEIYCLPMSICGLSRLETLDLHGCDNLQSLPDELPSSLTSLYVTCKSMETFPSRLSNLINLKELDFESCENLVEIPRDIGKLSQLETLTVNACDKLRTLPAEIGAISRLKELEISLCKNLQCILALPPSLFTIDVHSCISLKRLPDLSNLKELQSIYIVDCNELIEIQGFGKLESLTTLNIEACESLERLPDLSNLKKLQTLDIEFCVKLIEIQGFEKLELLTSLKISFGESLERLPDVSNLGMLKHLLLYGCKKLVEIEGLWGLKSLETLDVSGCTSLERLDLSSLKNLKELKILDCKNLTEIQGLEELESLGFLNIAGCKLIEKLPDLSNLKKLKILIALFCEKLTEIRGLEELKSLKLLDISGCESIERSPDLSNTRIDTNSSMAKYWELNGWDGYYGSDEWNRWELKEWELEEWEPRSPSSSSSSGSNSSSSPSPR